MDFDTQGLELHGRTFSSFIKAWKEELSRFGREYVLRSIGTAAAERDKRKRDESLEAVFNRVSPEERQLVIDTLAGKRPLTRPGWEEWAERVGSGEIPPKFIRQGKKQNRRCNSPLEALLFGHPGSECFPPLPARPHRKKAVTKKRRS